MVADVASGRARGYLAQSALNVVAVEDVAAGHLHAFERGRAGERYLLGGEDMSIRSVFASVARTAGLSAPRIGVPWWVAYGAALAANAALRPVGREPELLLLDEVRSGRLPHLFDDGKARQELGYTSRPADRALAEATHAALGRV
jgi:dihydroflavonol-4-reductase